MKIKTVTADSVRELDAKVNEELKAGGELMGEMQVYSEPHPHAVSGEEIWDNKFAQRIKTNE